VVSGHHLREAHNDYLQLAIEGGLLLGAPIAAAAVMFAAAVRRQFGSPADWTYWIRLGAVTGILAIAVQSLVEFSLQMPGNATFLAVLCALALHRRVSPPLRPDTTPSAASPGPRPSGRRVPRSATPQHAANFL
jgi:O-antigen ligase